MVPNTGMSEALSGERGGGARKATDPRRTRCQQSGLCAMRTAQSEVDQIPATRRKHAARGFGREQRL
jgi:hypothetical protein